MKSFEKSFDSVVMLTWSDWHTELRSNRYHYASRFAKFTKVIFVQADLKESSYYFEETELENVEILHIWEKYDNAQIHLLNEALVLHRCIKPIFWVYNMQFLEFLEQRFHSFIVYHATEDYLNSTTNFSSGEIYYKKLLSLTTKIDLLISVSEGVEEGFVNIAKYEGEKILISNGCDYHFYAPSIEDINSRASAMNIVFYQGNIFPGKLNYALLQRLITNMPDWEFWFCGKILYNYKEIPEFFSYPNVKYFGVLAPEMIRKLAYESTVGIIPFNENDYLINRSFPLKAFEYLACGLPVVSVPIKSLLPYSNVFYFAKTAEEFEKTIRNKSETRYNEKEIASRLKEARLQDYNTKFASAYSKLEATLNSVENKRVAQNKSLRVLIFYDPRTENAYELQKNHFIYSKHKIYFNSIFEKPNFDLVNFEAVILLHDMRKQDDLLTDCQAIQSLQQCMNSYGGYKILIVQENEHVENIRKLISAIGFHTVFSSVPKKYLRSIYSLTRFPAVQFISKWDFAPFIDDIPVYFEESQILDLLRSMDPVLLPESLFNPLDKFISQSVRRRSEAKHPLLPVLILVSNRDRFKIKMLLLIKSIQKNLHPQNIRNKIIACLKNIIPVPLKNFIKSILSVDHGKISADLGKNASNNVNEFLNNCNKAAKSFLFRLSRFNLHTFLVNLIPHGLRMFLIRKTPACIKLFLRKLLSHPFTLARNRNKCSE